MKITRRRNLPVTGSAVLGACHRAPQPTPARVSIVRTPGYTQDVYETVRRLLRETAPDVRGRQVVLKPNLVEFEPDSTINTHPLVVHAVLEGFRALGAAGVRIAEGPGHRRNTLDLAESAGYFKIVPGFEDRFVDLNLDEVSPVRAGRHSSLDKLYLPHTALAADLLVSIPKLKTHHWVVATLSMKNLFGTVPGGVYGWPKNVLHWAGINECVADLHAAYPRTFTVVDGIIGMEGNGPIQGTPKPAGVLVAGRDLVAVDATCCRIMGIDPLKVEYLRLAAGRALEQRLAETAIVQTGEPIAAAATPFALIPAFQSLRLGRS